MKHRASKESISVRRHSSAVCFALRLCTFRCRMLKPSKILLWFCKKLLYSYEWLEEVRMVAATGVLLSMEGLALECFMEGSIMFLLIKKLKILVL